MQANVKPEVATVDIKLPDGGVVRNLAFGGLCIPLGVRLAWSWHPSLSSPLCGLRILPVSFALLGLCSSSCSPSLLGPSALPLVLLCFVLASLVVVPPSLVLAPFS